MDGYLPAWVSGIKGKLTVSCLSALCLLTLTKRKFAEHGCQGNLVVYFQPINPRNLRHKSLSIFEFLQKIRRQYCIKGKFNLNRSTVSTLNFRISSKKSASVSRRGKIQLAQQVGVPENFSLSNWCSGKFHRLFRSKVKIIYRVLRLFCPTQIRDGLPFELKLVC